MSTATATGKNGVATQPTNRVAQISPQEQRKRQVVGILGSPGMMQQFKAALPKHITPERMLRVAQTALSRNPQLLECTDMSLYGCMIQASQLGLEFDGLLGHAYLIPFRNMKTNTTECTLIVGYTGLLKLARNSGQISTITACVVYENDVFKYTRGLTPNIIHEPCETEETGPVVAAYAVAVLKDGGIQFEVMRLWEILKIKDGSKAGKSGPWVTHFEEMAKKSVLRRLCKLLPSSIDLERAIAVADDHGNEMANIIGEMACVPAPQQRLTSFADTNLVIEQKPTIDESRAANLYDLAESAGLTGNSLATELVAKYSVDAIEQLTVAQADDFSSILRAKVNEGAKE